MVQRHKANQATRFLVQNISDFEYVPDGEFLQLLQEARILPKDTCDRLTAPRMLRNSAGHPNESQVKDTNVASHLDDLIQFVFEPFGK